MQESLECTFRKLVKEAVKEALLEVRDSFEFASIQARAMNVHREKHDVVSDTGELLIAATEARKILAVSGATLERLLRSGTIPSIKIGHLRRYSVSALNQWIQDAASTDKPQADADEKSVLFRKAKRIKLASKGKAKQSRSQPSFDPSKLPLSRIKDYDGHNQANPFRKLLAEIGVKYSDIRPTTNGEIKRIADVDVAICHGCLYLDHPLPDEAINRLKKHFLEIAKQRSS